jgi:hypothetical protein
MMIPGSAPSTPPSHDPFVLAGWPFSYSVESSPKYQTFAGSILRVPVERLLGDLALARHDVFDDYARHAHDFLRLGEDADEVLFDFPFGSAFVEISRSRLEGEVAIVD